MQVSFGNKYQIYSTDREVIHILSNEKNNLGDDVFFVSNELNCLNADTCNGDKYYSGLLVNESEGILLKNLYNTTNMLLGLKNNEDYQINQIIGATFRETTDRMNKFAINQKIVVNSIEELKQHPILKNIIKNIENLKL